MKAVLDYALASEKFVCSLYGLTQCSNVNEARYVKFCSNTRSAEPHKLPPTRDALLCHCKRVAYVTAVIKRSLERYPDVPRPYDGHGWIMDENGTLQIQWMLLPPAPEEVMQFITCGCLKSGCATNICVCKSHGLPCTDLCKCKNCTNSSGDDDEDFSDNDSDDDNDEDIDDQDDGDFSSDDSE